MSLISNLRPSAKFDGKPGTVEGPTIPPGASFVLTKTGPRSFKMTRTQDGKPLDMSTWTVSPDGKTIDRRVAERQARQIPQPQRCMKSNSEALSARRVSS